VESFDVRDIKRVTHALLVGAAIAMPLTAQTRAPSPGALLKIGDSRVYYEECGTGPDAVLLVHDGVVHSAVWDDVWPAFCRRGHTLRYDRRGYGKSSAATGWFAETDDMAAVLRQAGVTRATIVGSSHGGEVSINFTLEHPELVRRLVLVGAVVVGFPYSEHFLNRGAPWSELLGRGDVPGAARAIANDRYLVAPGNDAARKRLLDLLLASPQDITHSTPAIPPKPALPRLGEIRVPTLLLVGDADIPDVHAHAGAIEAGIPRSKRIVIPGTGHLMYLEKPELFTQTVMRFLDANP
jgi:3-oxoadipate enol-lactonase